MLYSGVAVIISEISFSPLHLKGNNDFFDGHGTSSAVSFAPILTLPLGGEGEGGVMSLMSFLQRPGLLS